MSSRLQAWNAWAKWFLLRKATVGWVEWSEPHQNLRDIDGGARSTRPTLRIVDLPQQRLVWAALKRVRPLTTSNANVPSKALLLRSSGTRQPAQAPAPVHLEKTRTPCVQKRHNCVMVAQGHPCGLSTIRPKTYFSARVSGGR